MIFCRFYKVDNLFNYCYTMNNCEMIIYPHSYKTKNTNLHTTSVILGSIIIVLGCVFICWCCCKIFKKKETERIFPCVSTMDLRGLGNDIDIEMNEPGPSQQKKNKQDKDVKEKDRKEDKKEKDKKEKDKKEDGKKDKKEKDGKEMDGKEKEKEEEGEKEKGEKKWWEHKVSLSDLLARQKIEDKREEKGEPEKGEPEKKKTPWDPLQDDSYYSPDED